MNRILSWLVMYPEAVVIIWLAWMFLLFWLNAKILRYNAERNRDS